MKSPVPYPSHRRAFTFLEVLIIIALLSATVAMGSIITLDTYHRHIFTSQSSILIGYLQTARNRSMNNVYQKSHGVRITPDAFVLFHGETEESMPRNPLVTIHGLDEIVFKQLSGETTSVGTITLSSNVRTLDIEIAQNGRINW